MFRCGSAKKCAAGIQSGLRMKPRVLLALGAIVLAVACGGSKTSTRENPGERPPSYQGATESTPTRSQSPENAAGDFAPRTDGLYYEDQPDIYGDQLFIRFFPGNVMYWTQVEGTTVMDVDK